MARKAPKLEVIKALLARSGNQCAFPNCSHPIINDKNKLIAQLCHIESANNGGERYNKQQNDEERRDYENLIFFCYRHHVETNDEKDFTVEKLKEIKSKHESKFKESNFKIEKKRILQEIQNDIDEFWTGLKKIHQIENTLPEDIKMEIDFDSDINNLFNDLRTQINHLELIISHLHESEKLLNNDLKETIKSIDFLGIVSKRINKTPYYKNPFINRNWDHLNLGVPNLSNKISILLDQIELKILEAQFLENPDDKTIKHKLKNIKSSLTEHAKNAGYHD